MKLIQKIFKMLGLTLGTVLLLLLIAGGLFINLSPQFGGKPTDAQKADYALADNYREGKFFNPEAINMNMSLSTIWSLIKDNLQGDPDRRPANALESLSLDSLDIAGYPAGRTRLTWFGHSAFLLEIDGKKILLDPMLGPHPAPHPTIGTSRYPYEMPIAIAQLPQIDAVIISHDHYDHLDYGSIMQLRDKVRDFYVPLGVGAHFVAWGVESERVHELNWWDETEHDGLKLACTPARHFSGRGLFDRFTTLWASWVIMGERDTLYFSGDSSYGPHFREIGKKYGPFDLAMMECGQYDRRWKDAHMMPEETAQAGLDVGAKVLVPIHWGAFTLALHSWTDPVERLSQKAAELGQPVSTPRIGEPIVMDQRPYPARKWWQ